MIVRGMAAEFGSLPGNAGCNAPQCLAQQPTPHECFLTTFPSINPIAACHMAALGCSLSQLLPADSTQQRRVAARLPAIAQHSLELFFAQAQADTRSCMHMELPAAEPQAASPRPQRLSPIRAYHAHRSRPRQEEPVLQEHWQGAPLGRSGADWHQQQQHPWERQDGSLPQVQQAAWEGQGGSLPPQQQANQHAHYWPAAAAAAAESSDSFEGCHFDGANAAACHEGWQAAQHQKQRLPHHQACPRLDLADVTSPLQVKLAEWHAKFWGLPRDPRSCISMHMYLHAANDHIELQAKGILHISAARWQPNLACRCSTKWTGMQLGPQAMTSCHITGVWPHFQPGGGNTTRQRFSSISLCTRAKPSSTPHKGSPTFAIRQATSCSTSS